MFDGNWWRKNEQDSDDEEVIRWRRTTKTTLRTWSMRKILQTLIINSNKPQILYTTLKVFFFIVILKD